MIYRPTGFFQGGAQSPQLISNDPRLKRSRKFNIYIQNSQLSDNVYTWCHENGQLHASNTRYPTDNNSLKSFKENNTYQKSKKINIEGNRIFAPVTLNNTGKSITIHMLLDTGCSKTNIPFRYQKTLRPKYDKKITSTLGHGSKQSTWKTTLDYVKAGFQTEKKLRVAGSKAEGSDNKGLLGRGFFKNRPFEIDFKNELIIWK